MGRRKPGFDVESCGELRRSNQICSACVDVGR